MKRLVLTALAVLTVASAMVAGAADEKRDGEKFNPRASCRRYFVTRTVDSTGKAAGRKDSAVVICPPQVMPVPVLIGGVDETDTSSVAFRMNSSTGGVTIYDPNAANRLDFGVTNLIASVAIDSGGTGGTNFRYSAAVDVRQYSMGNIIIHITAASAADTVGIYDYGVTVFPLTSATLDWATVGVPINTNPTLTIREGVAGGNDSLGFWSVNPNAVNMSSGERSIRLLTDRTTSNYANINAYQTVSYPWTYWLGATARPRYLAVQIRLKAKTIAGNLTPSVRVDLEGLR